jgi:hypothetical protein
MNPEAVLRDMPAQEQRFVIGIDYGTTYTGMRLCFYQHQTGQTNF